MWRARGDGVINTGKISTQEVCAGAWKEMRLVHI